MMQNFWNWLVKSSTDSTQVALTAKGLLTTLVPILLIVVHNPNLSDLPDEAYSFIIAVFGVISALMVLFGLARKLYLTFVPAA